MLSTRPRVDADGSLGRFVRETLFQRVKFITSNAQIQYNSQLCNFILTKMNVNKDEQKDWWDSNSASVRRQLNQRRKKLWITYEKHLKVSCSSNFLYSFYWAAWTNKSVVCLSFDGTNSACPVMPSLEMVEMLRENKEAYSFYCYFFLPMVYDKQKFFRSIQSGKNSRK